MDQDRYENWVEELAEGDTRWRALNSLMEAGRDATPALRSGLAHRHASVRRACCMVLDHHLDADAVPELLANVGHRNRRVRAWALHALACDRCKEGDCRPGPSGVVPVVIDRLANDPSSRVRRMAVILGLQYLDEAGVADALARAAIGDPHPRVARLAQWALKRRGQTEP